MRLHLRLLSEFLRLPANEKILSAKIFVLLFFYNAVLIIVPSVWIARWIDLFGNEEPFQMSKRAECLVKTFRKVAAHSPIQFSCLVQAVTLRRCLRTYGIRAGVHIGYITTTREDSPFHAWIESDGQMLINEVPRDQVRELHRGGPC